MSKYLDLYFEKLADTVSVPLMITREMRQALADQGFTPDRVNAMTPQEANNILNGSGGAPQQTASAPQPAGAVQQANQRVFGQNRILQPGEARTPRPRPNANPNLSPMENNAAAKLRLDNHVQAGGAGSHNLPTDYTQNVSKTAPRTSSPAYNPNLTGTENAAARNAAPISPSAPALGNSPTKPSVVGPGMTGNQPNFWNTPFKDSVPRLWEGIKGNKALGGFGSKMMTTGNMSVGSAVKSVGSRANELAKTVVSGAKAAPSFISNLSPKTLGAGALTAGGATLGGLATVGRGIAGGAVTNAAMDQIPAIPTQQTETGDGGTAYTGMNYLGEVGNAIGNQIKGTATGAGAGLAQAGPAGVIPGAAIGAATSVGGDVYNTLTAGNQMDQISQGVQDSINAAAPIQQNINDRLKANPGLRLVGNEVQYATGQPVKALTVNNGVITDRQGQTRTIGDDGRLAPVAPPQPAAPAPAPAPAAPPTAAPGAPASFIPQADIMAAGQPQAPAPAPAAPQREYEKVIYVPGKGWGAWMPSQSGDRFVSQNPNAQQIAQSLGMTPKAPTAATPAPNSPADLQARGDALRAQSGQTTQTPYGPITMTMPPAIPPAVPDPQKRANYS